MTDLTITAANVVAGSNAKLGSGTAGASITAGQAVYYDSATGTLKLADNNGVAAAQVPVGIALHAAAAGQPLQYITEGDLTIGATMTASLDYYLSATPGGVAPRADLSAGMAVVSLGYAKSTTVLGVKIQATGVTL